MRCHEKCTTIRRILLTVFYVTLWGFTLKVIVPLSRKVIFSTRFKQCLNPFSFVFPLYECTLLEPTRSLRVQIIPAGGAAGVKAFQECASGCQFTQATIRRLH